MKNKKRFSIAKLCLGYSAKKNYLIYLFLILLSVGINSCKKDLLVPNTSKIDTNKDKIKSISYAQFLTSINLNNTGILKTSLSNAIKTDKGALMNNDAGSNGFIIDTDSIKKLTLGDTVSYVIRLKQETPRAIQFRNLTIQVVNNNTTAFVTTYVPDKEWRNELKNGHQIAFKGTHFSQSIELSNLKSLTFSSVPDVDVTYKPQKLQSTNYKQVKKPVQLGIVKPIMFMSIYPSSVHGAIGLGIVTQIHCPQV